MEILNTYNVIIATTSIIIVSFLFGEVSRKTNVPSVLMLIILGIVLKFGLEKIGLTDLDYLPILRILGTVGLIMIVLEAALELELKKEKYIPIALAAAVALIGLMASTYVAALILNAWVEGMTMPLAWLYATPLSILSSAIIIPSVSGFKLSKKEFHIYESTFSDIFGIMLFYYLTSSFENSGHGSELVDFSGNVVLTIVLSLIASYLIVLIFQNIKSHTKLFLLISVLLLLYAIGKRYHLSSLIIILIFGLLIANIKLIKDGFLGKWVNMAKAKEMYAGLHVITMETAFVVRTFFFVIFGLTISLASLANMHVAVVSLLIIASIYLIRFLILLVFIGRDMVPQLFIAPRGLITILLFYDIPENAIVPAFEPGILLFIIIASSLIMTIAMVLDKRKTGASIRKAQSKPIGYEKWKAPSFDEPA